MRVAPQFANLLEANDPKHFNPPCLPCQTYGFARWGIGGDYSDTFLSHPNIAGLKQYHMVNEEGIGTSAYVFDIVENAVDVYTGRSIQSFDPFTVRLEQGLRDSVTETLLISVDKDQVVSGVTISIERHEKLEEVSASRLSEYLTSVLATRSSKVTQTDSRYLLVEDETLSAIWWDLNPLDGTVVSKGASGEGIAWIALLPLAVGLTIGVANAANCYFRTLHDSETMTARQHTHCISDAIAGFAAGALVTLMGVPGLYGAAAAAFGAIALQNAVWLTVKQFFNGELDWLLWQSPEFACASILSWGCTDTNDWLDELNQVDRPPPARPACIALSSVVPSGSAGSIGTDGDVCLYSCGQLKSLGSTAFNACKNWGDSWCEPWNDYYVPEIPRCCTSGVPVCR